MTTTKPAPDALPEMPDDGAIGLLKASVRDRFERWLGEDRTNIDHALLVSTAYGDRMLVLAALIARARAYREPQPDAVPDGHATKPGAEGSAFSWVLDGSVWRLDDNHGQSGWIAAVYHEGDSLAFDPGDRTDNAKEWTTTADVPKRIRKVTRWLTKHYPEIGAVTLPGICSPFPAKDDDGWGEWTKWHGGAWALSSDVVVDVEYRNGPPTFPGSPWMFRWVHDNAAGDGDLVRYRTHKPAP
jgi:hypothetical protein